MNITQQLMTVDVCRVSKAVLNLDSSELPLVNFGGKMDTTKVYPLDLLTDRGNRKPTALASVYNPLAAATLGFITACLTNFAYRKPIFSGN